MGLLSLLLLALAAAQVGLVQVNSNFCHIICQFCGGTVYRPADG
jgi:hypothetical protein